MPVIRISDTTWERLKQWAVPLEDTAEDALCRVLDMAQRYKENTKMDNITSIKTTSISHPLKKRRESRGKLSRGLRTPQHAFRRPILKALVKLNGKGSVDQVLRLVEEMMQAVLNDIDRETLPAGGDIRWHNAAQWERKIMVDDGLLKADSPHGLWELTDKGYQDA